MHILICVGCVLSCHFICTNVISDYFQFQHLLVWMSVYRIVYDARTNSLELTFFVCVCVYLSYLFVNYMKFTKNVIDLDEKVERKKKQLNRIICLKSSELQSAKNSNCMNATMFNFRIDVIHLKRHTLNDASF